MNRRTTTTLSLAGVTGLAAVGLVAAPAGAAPETVEYVALGDSYAAGNGASSPLTGDPVDEDCLRTSNGYADRLADGLEATTGATVALDLEACSGATTRSTQLGSDPAPGIDGQPRNVEGPDQLAALGGDTDLVTVTAGANDTDFTAVLQTCLFSPSNCESAVQAGAALYDGQELVDLLLAVDAALAEAGSADPVPVVVTGYSQLFDIEGVARRQCGFLTFAPSSPEVAEAINAGTRTLNEQIAAATAQAATLTTSTAIQFVDVDPVFEDNRICSDQPWLNPPALFVPFERWVHPNDAGHAAYAETIGAVVDLGGGELPVLAEGRDPQLSAILECVVDNGDGTLTARFGYENRETDDPAEFRIPEGPDNRLVGPVTATDGPVTDFVQPGVVPDRPGRTPFGEGAFTATFGAEDEVVWALHGRTATASAGSARCS